jgi:hypothetical protein
LGQIQPLQDSNAVGDQGGGEARIAIVLGAVSIVAEARWLAGLSAMLTVLAALLTLNGFFLLVELPLE